MAEKHNLTIEDEIFTHLDGELREQALEFITYLRENQLSPQPWFGPTFWIFPWDGNNLFGMHLKKGSWHFWFFSGDYSGEADEEVVKLVQDNVGHCVNCSGECESKGVDLTIFGNDYANLCYQFPVRFGNPDNETLEKIKKLIELWKDIAPHSNGIHIR